MKLLKYILLLTTPFLFYIVFVARGIFSLDNSLGIEYSPTEEESTYLTALSIYRGENLYSNFSIVYPPGRFLALSALFHLLSPSIPTARLYFNLFAPLIFSSSLFYLAYIISGFLFKKNNGIYYLLLRFILSLIPPLIYFSSVNSAQDIHAITGLFMICLLTSFKPNALRYILLGFLFGLIFLFRIDAGIIVTIALVCNYLFIHKGILFIKNNIPVITSLILGFSIIWIPVLWLLIFHGSITNFIHDLFYMGLIVQPKVMSLPIPPPPIGLVFLSTLIFLLSGSISLFVYARRFLPGQAQYALSVFAVFTLLNFVSALGRSDEGHLWYALAFIPIYIPFLLFTIFQIKNIRLLFTSSTLYIAFSLFVIAKVILFVKSPSLFLIITVLLFIAVVKIKDLDYRKVLIAGSIVSIIIFHSFTYLMLRFIRPGLPRSHSYPSNFFSNEPNEIGGLTYNETHKTVLQQIKKDMSDAENNYLFIFPDNVLYYEYFQMRNPTRYYYLVGEYTEKTDREIIDAFKKTNTQYFLLFPKNVVMGNQTVLRWILKNTEIKKKYNINEVKIELRKSIK